MHLTTKKIYEAVAKEHGLTVKQVEEIVLSQFQFVKDIMATGVKNKPETFKSIQLTHLGKFAVRKYKLEEYARRAKGEH